MKTIHADVAKFRTPVNAGVQSQKGNALIEFAFVLPVFLVLLFGMVTFSLGIYDKTVLTMATREGARAGAVYDAGNYDSDGDLDVTSVQTKARNATLAVLANKLISFGSKTPTVDNPSITGDILTVTAHLNYTGIFFLTGGQDISATSSMRIEGL